MLNTIKPKGNGVSRHLSNRAGHSCLIHRKLATHNLQLKQAVTNGNGTGKVRIVFCFKDERR